jgi:hypothetical protein
MNKEIYDLSIQTQATSNQRILKADSGKEYNVSFVPAIVNRKYYERWVEIKKEFSEGYPTYLDLVSRKIDNLTEFTKEELDFVEKFKKLAKDGQSVSQDLIIYVIRANGYKDFDLDELEENFSMISLDIAVNYIMRLNTVTDEIKKKNLKEDKS